MEGVLVDQQVQHAMKRMVKANRQVIAAMGVLMLASLNATKAMQDLTQEVERSGSWREATKEEAEAVEEEIADMVATYSSQVN